MATKVNTPNSQFNTRCEIRYGMDRTAVVDYHSDAICPEAEKFSEILLFCHMAIHGFRYSAKENRPGAAAALMYGADLDRAIEAERAGYPLLLDSGNGDVKARVSAAMSFSLMQYEKHKCKLKPKIAMDARWDLTPTTMLRFMAQKRADDEEFLSHLTAVARRIADISSTRDVYAKQAPLVIASDECNSYVRAMMTRDMKAGGLSDEDIDEWFDLEKMAREGGLDDDDIAAVFSGEDLFGKKGMRFKK